MGTQTLQNKIASGRDCPGLPPSGHIFGGSNVAGRDYLGAQLSLHSAGTHMLTNTSGPGNMQKMTLTGRDRDGYFSLIDNQIKETSRYFSDFEILAKEELGRRATSYQSEGD